MRVSLGGTGKEPHLRDYGPHVILMLATSAPAIAQVSGSAPPCVAPAEPQLETPATNSARQASCRGYILQFPQDPRGYRVLGGLLLDDPPKRIDVYEAGLQHNPTDYELTLNLGLALRQAGRLEDAETALEKAAALAPRDPDPLVQAGLVAQERRDYRRAEQLLRAALALPNVIPETHGYLARALASQQRYSEAVAEWDIAETTSPHGFIDEAGDRAAYNRARLGSQ